MEIATPTLNERFEVRRTLNDDGQTRTLLAFDTQTSQLTVLKELNLGKAFDWKSIELFERESTILQHLKHPSIPTYIDAFRTDHDTRLFLAQKHIEGETLEARLNNATPFDEQRVRELLDQMLDVLTYLHDFSPPVVHRDISPANILCDDHGRFHLINFGAVQTIIQDQIGGSTIVGTSGYMPPEQLMGRAQPATDIYALAATCVALASGMHAVDIPVQLMKLQFRDHVSLSEQLCDILEKMLEPDISERFTRPEQVQQALQSGHTALAEIPSEHNQLAGFYDLKKLIANAPSKGQTSDITLHNNTLSITLKGAIDTPVAWKSITIPIVLGILVGIIGYQYEHIGLILTAIPLILFAPILLTRIFQIRPETGFHRLTLSPHEIEFSNAIRYKKQQPPEFKVYRKLPLSRLTNCYMDAEYERAMSPTASLREPPPRPPYRHSGIYFMDDNQKESCFSTASIARQGTLGESAPNAFHEAEWIYQAIQLYLQTVSTNPAPPQTR